MTSIERTAYPYISANKSISKKTLVTNYTLSKEELEHIYQNVRGNRLKLNYAIQLKALMNLGYFADTKEIPSLILEYIRKQLKLPHNLQPFYEHHKTLSRHRISIRTYLKVTPWKSKGDGSAQRIAMQAAYKASQTMNSPADIINVVIGELIERHFELPVFNTLDRLVCHVRAKVNQSIFQNVMGHLKAQGLIKNIDKLLVVEKGETYSGYQKLKQSPKALTITNFKEHINHHTWLMNLGTMELFSRISLKLNLNNLQKKLSHLILITLKIYLITKNILLSFACCIKLNKLQKTRLVYLSVKHSFLSIRRLRKSLRF